MNKPRAIVTGASGGIGRVVTRRLLIEGYEVLAMAFRQEPTMNLCAYLDEDEDAINKFDWSFIRVDIKNEQHVSEVIKEVSKGGELKLLVTCHGAKPNIRPTSTLSVDDWNVIYTDLGGTFHAANAAGRAMLTQGGGGSLVLLSSFHALGTYPQRTPYAVAKAGICGLARSLSVEWAGRGIRVNAIAPGQVIGPRTDSIANRVRAQSGQDIIAKMKARSPAYKLVDPEDIAETVVWLTKTPAVNGQTIVLDHAVTASLWYEEYENPNLHKIYRA